MQGKRGPRGPKGKRGPIGNRASRGARGPDGDRGPMGDSAPCWNDSNAKRCTSNWESMGLTRREDLNKGCLFGYQTSYDRNLGVICKSENPSCSYVKNTGRTSNNASWNLNKSRQQDVEWLRTSNEVDAKNKFNKWVKDLRRENCPGVPAIDTQAIWNLS